MRVFMYVCVCVFNVILISAEVPFKWTLFLKFQNQNLYSHLFYFVCATCFTKHFNIYWTR